MYAHMYVEYRKILIAFIHNLYHKKGILYFLLSLACFLNEYYSYGAIFSSARFIHIIMQSDSICLMDEDYSAITPHSV